ncbi:hydrophobe/amphiphile efflux-1 family RND transporter [Kaistia algarum]|uniref:efflux RND transporter permease subunit n=1 Tax=Kaistia algarum TaxID=2083279 RepID=UPI000CE8AA76|nr:efflux RND transporter permease subunit [Kaistia algarum]MCX5513915.1 efflux RND transporter permease subunit [Kaistia algarum]PPE77547.1 hydrophobe/amphiphile efflux-1 family RND transporter [Kaistia algarum]
MAAFFIDRPIFAWVLAIVVMLAGLLGVYTLPIAQYPEIAPTTVRISASYPGASAETVENSVTKIIEQGMTGLENLTYMSGSSSASGQASIQLTFDSGVDSDIAQVQVQNKLQLVESQLPDAVVNQGITVTKSTSSILMVGALVSTDGSLASADLGDYFSSTFEDAIKRVEGVGDVNVFGSGYAMRIWLDPDKLAKFQLMPGDVSSAITVQNRQVSAGQLGDLPSPQGQQLNVTVTAQSQLQTPDEFRRIILKTSPDGSIVRLGDVARVEIGSESYTSLSRYNGLPAAGFGINLATGANAINTSAGVKAVMEQLSGSLPSTIQVVYPYDTTPFVQLSIEKVFETLIEAVVLVFLVMLLFLQNIRATLIPTIAVPVVLLGTFGVLSFFGYSINTLTMFAMVLAIGLLVDDAIVVVENVERVMAEEGLPPREATRKSMNEITGALIGIALVLSAVFLPMAFFSGSVGVIYRQFSVTIVSAMVLSVLVAIILTPALCATLLKPAAHGERKGFFGWFNRNFERATGRYERGVHGVIRRPLRFLALFLIMVCGVYALFTTLPSSFLPEEDQGVLMASITLPAGATQARTLEVVKQVEAHFANEEKDSVDSVFAALGFGFNGNGQNSAMAFIKLKDFDERKGAGRGAQAIAGRAMAAFAKIRDAQVFAMMPPVIPNLGQSNGFEMYLQDTGGAGQEKLKAARDQLLAAAAQDGKLSAVRQGGQADQPEFKVGIDQEKAKTLGVDLSDINTTLSIAFAGSYVNDFLDRGKIKPVWLQADGAFRASPASLNSWYARNASGEMVPFSSFSSSSWTQGSPKLDRYNGISAVSIQGSAAAGVSSGTAMDEMLTLVAKLPSGFTAAWTGLSYQEQLSGNQALALYAISILVVFLCLAALYESWSIPFSVLLAVPIGVLGALVAAKLFGQSNDVYFKVGLLTTIGLSAKNAILIVEFARDQQAAGKELVEATLLAARQRLRPILMTSFAFILGVLPLAIATGAGSGAQNAVGIGVMGGMLAATAIGIFFVPMFYVVVRRLSERLSKGSSAVAAPTAEPHLKR